ncbi:MAG: hypothetical protein R2822_14005 [Spirosomataceae bacterium]
MQQTEQDIVQIITEKGGLEYIDEEWKIRVPETDATLSAKVPKSSELSLLFSSSISKKLLLRLVSLCIRLFLVLFL